MRRLLLLQAILIHCFQGNCQSEVSEFETYSNGFIYKPGDMKVLRKIADSLNLIYGNQTLNKTYYSWQQGRLFYVSFKGESSDLNAIVKEVEAQSSFYEVVTRYKSFVAYMDTTKVVGRKRIFTDSSNATYDYLTGNPFWGYDGFYMERSFKQKTDVAGQWSYEYFAKTSNSSKPIYELSCHYFPDSLQSQKLPPCYARLIDYTDCIIDTSSSIFLGKKLIYGYEDEPYVFDAYYLSINNYINRFLHKTNHGNNDYEYAHLTSEKIKLGIRNITDTGFTNLIKRATAFYMKTRDCNSEMEELITATGYPEKALFLKRHRKIGGGCSMDEAPRIHMQNIALLSANTGQWNVFIRAHLDIMNDRFMRATDGPYAFGPRKTYIKELEALDIDIVDLVLGLTLYAANTASNHYQGDIYRLGRAISESAYRKNFEEKAITMIKDNNLDRLNRELIFYLYVSYLQYLDPKEIAERTTSLKRDLSRFPPYLQDYIKRLL